MPAPMATPIDPAAADLFGRAGLHHLGVVLHREVDLGQFGLDVGRHFRHGTTVDRGHDVQSARHGLPLNARRCLRDPYVRNPAQPDMSAGGPVDQQVADGLDAQAGLRHALNDDVEDLLLLEHAADLNALEQRGLGATDIARTDAESLGLLQVDLDLDGRLGRLRLHLGLDDAVDLGHQILDAFTLLGENLRILSVQSHRDRGAQPGQEIETVGRDLVRSLVERADIAKLLGRVRRHLSRYPGHGDRRLLDQFDRVLVIDIGFHARPRRRWSSH